MPQTSCLNYQVSNYYVTNYQVHYHVPTIMSPTIMSPTIRFIIMSQLSCRQLSCPQLSAKLFHWTVTMKEKSTNLIYTYNLCAHAHETYLKQVETFVYLYIKQAVTSSSTRFVIRMQFFFLVSKFYLFNASMQSYKKLKTKPQNHKIRFVNLPKKNNWIFIFLESASFT